MKTLMLLTLIGINMNLNAQKEDEKAITTTIETFAKAGDNNDRETLATTLDDNYRIIMNRLFGGDVVSIMGKEVYLEKIATKEYGGDSREVEVKSITIVGTTACVNVLFKGQKMTFDTIMILVKNKGAEWKIISDTPQIQ